MDFVIVTGLSGAGKTRAVNAFEDIGYYCVDNIPPKLVSKFAELCLQSNDKISKVAIVMDARGGELFSSFFEGLEDLKRQGCDYKILFLDAQDEVLIRRYKETRRRHPLANTFGTSVEKCVEFERELLLPMRARADYIIDTSFLSPAQLKERITGLFLGDSVQGMMIQCMSFGFKYGSPSEADLVFDVRCLPNPFYIDELKRKTGLDKPVRDYVFQFDQTTGFLTRLYDMIDYLIPLYTTEGKSQLVIGIGCTGGKHRSVSIAEALCQHLVSGGRRAMVNHRDIQKP
ncbi:MAG: RNase adapter RapZ [Clostridiales bacterium]|nr:RNase adapter RapZ [Clostridiales bacterium]